jgi:hypothetical protein
MPKKSEIRLVYDGLYDHKPVQVGNTYCSPACGRGCKLAQYRKAVRGAAALQKKLKGNWTGRVFEKLGWHFEANSGPLTVSGDYHGKRGTVRYTCYLKGHLVLNVAYTDPREAVAKVLHHCSSAASTALTMLELAYKAAGQEENFLGWLRHACPSLARRNLGDHGPDQDGGWSESDPPGHTMVASGEGLDPGLADFVNRLSSHLDAKKAARKNAKRRA